LGGVLLIVLIGKPLHLGVKGIAVTVMILCAPWMYFSYLARKEYIATVRKRFEARRLDLEGSRISVQDAATIRLLEETAAGDNARRAAYALSLLAEASSYEIRPLLQRLAASPLPEVREKVYQIGTQIRWDGVLEQAMNEWKGAPADSRVAR